MDLNTPVHNCPEGAPVRDGINIEENTVHTKLRLIIKTNNIRLYFRVRQPYISGNTYICDLEYI
jgi:hypothetical protein